MHATVNKTVAIYDTAKPRQALVSRTSSLSSHKEIRKMCKAALEFKLQTTQLQTKEMQINPTY
jgi:type IV secretory pathway component VirB8